MPADLDLRDLVEVRRRLACPVVSCLVGPDELEAVEVVVEDATMLRIGFRACGEWVGSPFRWPLLEEPVDPELFAAELYDALRDEIAKSRFAWGEWREGEYEVLPPSGVR